MGYLKGEKQMYNKVILMGRLARDVDTRTTQSGKTVSRFTLAVDRRKHAEGQPSADFLNCIAWGKMAEFCQNYLRKGTKILLEGQLQSRSYEANDGSKRYVTEVNTLDIEFAESKKDTTQQAGAIQGTAVDDIPF